MNIKHHFHQKYKVLSKNGIPCILGLGSFGTVQLANNIETNQLFAIKKIFNKISKKQVQIHSKLHHFNIIRLQQAFFDYQKNCTILVLEYANNGSLFDFLKSSNFKDSALVLKIFKGICQGIAYLHRNSIIHRDIKPQNILLDQDYNPKICDFGSAYKGVLSNQLCGTQQYMAPQILMRKEYNRKVDVWSLGVLLYQMIEGNLSKKSIQNLSSIKLRNHSSKLSSNSKENFEELIQQILVINPQERLQINQIIHSKLHSLEEIIFNQEKNKQRSTRISTSTEQNQNEEQFQNMIHICKDNISSKSFQTYQANSYIYRTSKQKAISIKQYKKAKRLYTQEIMDHTKTSYLQNSNQTFCNQKKTELKKQTFKKISLKKKPINFKIQ